MCAENCTLGVITGRVVKGLASKRENADAPLSKAGPELLVSVDTVCSLICCRRRRGRLGRSGQ